MMGGVNALLDNAYVWDYFMVGGFTDPINKTDVSQPFRAGFRGESAVAVLNSLRWVTTFAS